MRLAFEWGAVLSDPEGLLRHGPSSGRQVRDAVLRPHANVPVGPLTLLQLEELEVGRR